MRCADLRGLCDNPRREWQYNVEVSVNWIDLAQESKTWRAVVSTVRNLVFNGPCIIAIVDE